jgi:hypothetical protein
LKPPLQIISGFSTATIWLSLNDGQEEDFLLMKAEIYKANPVFHDLGVL